MTTPAHLAYDAYAAAIRRRYRQRVCAWSDLDRRTRAAWAAAAAAVQAQCAREHAATLRRVEHGCYGQPCGICDSPSGPQPPSSA